MLTHAPWSKIAGVRHGFLEASECGRDPDWSAVVGTPVFLPKQVHGAVVLEAATPLPAGAARPEADAVVSSRGRALAGILTADCVPVLLLDRGGRAAAAAHAGWRGAAAGVLEASLAHLREHHGVASTDVEAVIGPAIGPCCYQIGPEVRAAFEQRTGDITRGAWETRADGLYVDLRRAAQALLEAQQVASVAILGGCTRCDRRFHSFRRDGANAGRQLSFIGWC